MQPQNPPQASGSCEEECWKELKRVFRYLAGTKHLPIAFMSGETEHEALSRYCGADWAGPHSEMGLSTSGFVSNMAGRAISWTSKKQPCVRIVDK